MGGTERIVILLFVVFSAVYVTPATSQGTAVNGSNITLLSSTSSLSLHLPDRNLTQVTITLQLYSHLQNLEDFNISLTFSSPLGSYLRKGRHESVTYNQTICQLVYMVSLEYHSNDSSLPDLFSDSKVNLTGTVNFTIQFFSTVLTHSIPILITADIGTKPNHKYPYSISISKSVSKFGVKLHCCLEGQDAILYDLTFHEESHQPYPIEEVQLRSNGREKRAWISLAPINETAYGTYKCCASPKLNDNPPSICSDPTYVLPQGSTENIFVRHFVPHNQSVLLRSCENGRRYVLYLKDRSTEVIDLANTSAVNLSSNSNQSVYPHQERVFLSLLSQQAKHTCVNATSGEVLYIEYVLADYTPIEYIWPVRNGTILPPQESGLSLTVDCRATGSPAPRVYWYDDWYEYTEEFDWRIRTRLRDGMRLHIKYLQNHIFENYWIWCIAETVWEHRVRMVKYPDVTPTPVQPVNTSEFSFSIYPPVMEVGMKLVLEANVGSGHSVFPICEHRQNSTFQMWQIGNGIFSAEKNASLSDAGEWNCSVIVYPYSDTIFIEQIKLYISKDLIRVRDARSSLFLSLANMACQEVSIFLHLEYYLIDPEKFDISLSVKGPPGYFVYAQISNNSLVFNESDSSLLFTTLLCYRDDGKDDTILLDGQNLTGLLQWDVAYWTKSISHAIPLTVSLPTESLKASGLSMDTTKLVSLLVIPIALAVLVVGCGLVMWFWRRRAVFRRKAEYNNLLSPSQRMLQDLADKLDGTSLLFQPEQLSCEKDILGEGAFGVVRKATLVSGKASQKVAVKSLKGAQDEGNLLEFLDEFWTLHNTGCHANIINLIGATVDIRESSLHIIIEFASGGNLLKHLRDQRRTGERLSWKQGLSYAVQIANGMTYLENKQCIHCDLAARNVLLTNDGVLKVSDFGMARKNYYEFYPKNITPKTKLPLKWMATESLESQLFTSKSDVWSFGVLLWEIATLGGSPYAGMAIADLLTSLKNGYRLSRPHNCPLNVYTVMRSCWLPEPHQRPNFTQLYAMLSLLLEDMGTLGDNLADIDGNLCSTDGYDDGDDDGEDLCSIYTGSTISELNTRDCMDDIHMDMRSHSYVNETELNDRHLNSAHETDGSFCQKPLNPGLCTNAEFVGSFKPDGTKQTAVPLHFVSRDPSVDKFSTETTEICPYCKGFFLLDGKPPSYQNIITQDTGKVEPVVQYFSNDWHGNREHMSNKHSKLLHKDSCVCRNECGSGTSIQSEHLDQICGSMYTGSTCT